MCIEVRYNGVSRRFFSIFLCVFVFCVSDTTEENHYLLPFGDHVKASRSFPASYCATTHPQSASLSYPRRPSLLFRYHTPWSHFPAPYLPGSLSPRRLRHHTPRCNPRYKRLNKKPNIRDAFGKNKNGRVWIPKSDLQGLQFRHPWLCEDAGDASIGLRRKAVNEKVVPGWHAYHLRLLRNSFYLNSLLWLVSSISMEVQQLPVPLRGIVRRVMLETLGKLLSH